MNSDGSIRIMLVLCLSAIGTIAYLAIARSPDLRIVTIQATTDNGLVTRLDMQIEGLDHGDESLRFAVDWAGNPQSWRELKREKTSDGRVEIQIAPETAMDIPPNIRVGNGQIRTRPFRARINRPGESSYTVSPVLSFPANKVPLTNPTFNYWDRSLPVAAPIGWHPSIQMNHQSTVRIGPSGNGKGLSASIEQTSRSSTSWVEASLIQIVPSLGSCYEVRLETSSLYQEDDLGRPVSATGVQITQNQSSAWWVLSSNQESNTQVHDDTAIVEIPAALDVPTTIKLHVENLDEQALEVGSEAVIKVFNASLAPTSGVTTTSFEWIRAVTCGRR